jgi:GGDEF domain-containing protein
VGWRLEELVHPDDRPAFAAVRAALEAGRSRVLRLRLRAWDLGFRRFELLARGYGDPDGGWGGEVTLWRPLREGQPLPAGHPLPAGPRATDPSPAPGGGIPRSPACSSDVLERLARLHRQGRRRTLPLTLVLCTLEEGAILPARPGTTTGERLWHSLADRLARAMGPDALVSRFGEAMLLAVAGDVGNHRGARALAGRIHAALAVPSDIDHGPIAATPRVGVALERPGDSLDDLLERAHQALRQAGAMDPADRGAIAIL